MPDPKRIYRWLLKLHPARFREEYGEPLERQFWDEYREVQGRGRRVLYWLSVLTDLAASIPAQIAHETGQDIRHAGRVYRKRPLVTALALVALALAIGATTGVFSVLNSLLLRSLPFRDAGLVTLRDPPVDVQDGRTAFEEWRNRSAYLQQAAAYVTWEMNLALPGESARARVSETSAGFFATLGVEPALGRAFSAEEDRPGRGDVAVIAYGLWQQLFGGDGRALGATIRLNGAQLTVVGVAPPGFDYPAKTSVWTPSVFDWKRLPKSVWLSTGAIGRLKPGLRMAQASAMFEAEVQRMNPRSLTGDERHRARLLPIRDELSGSVARASLVLMGAVGFVLLIACANVAHLLFSRTAERRPEWMIRAALGASRARLVQQLITEGIMLTLAAAAAGLVVAHWASRVASLARPTQLSALAQAAKLSPTYTIWDWRVLAFTVGTAIVTGVLFGALPAFLMGRMLQAQDVIRLQPGTHGWSAGRMRTVLIAMQALLTVVLLAGSLSMGRTFLKLVGVDLGFRVDQVVTLNVSLQGTRYSSDVTRRQYYADALERLHAVPGVVSAGAIQNLPLMLNTATVTTKFQLDSTHRINSSLVPVSPGYFRAIGTDIVEGRDFTPDDRQRSEPVGIVNEALARQLGVNSGMVGRKILCFAGKKEYTIVGVVRTERFNGPSLPGWPRFFTHLDQQPPPFVTFVARTRGRPEPYLSLCRSAVQQVDRQVPVYDVQTMNQRLDDLLAGARFYTVAILFFAALAMLLSVIGVYGVAAHSIAQRTHEIGVRIAVGAAPFEVRLMLLRQSVVPVAAGMIAGIAASLGLGRLIGHLVEQAQPTGTWMCGAAALVLMATAAAAVWTATRRVTQIDAMSTLRAE
jgi:predicted permease